ncbi:MAG: AAA family ATPase, partial [Deltaproteobacteria bacterium]|nr:AAA family ATPase [Deltaproteobacteria bacterium]
MYERLIKLPATHSFFLFGARGTGKSTLIDRFYQERRGLWLDFLNPDTEEDYARDPNRLEREVQAMRKGQWVVLDEIQKVPKLLNVVHSLIEKKAAYFALTGSSGRKLKAGGADLLAGRAFVFGLYPLVAEELGEDFRLDTALRWGTLPK